MVSAERQKRPDMPRGECPFCPGSGKVPDDYDVFVYDNDFPILRPDPAAPDDVAGGPYRTAPACGTCEVILYSPSHTATLPQLPAPHVARLVDVLADRTAALGRDPSVKYVFPFENRGEEVGVTMPHPHGQLYAYPFVPLKVAAELECCRAHHARTGRCLLCDMNAEELSFGRRVVAANDSFVCYLPFFTDYPYGAFVVARDHLGALPQLSAAQRRDLAAMLRSLAGAFDALFDRLFPYMMCVHQSPVNSPAHDGHEEFYHFHVEFYPPLRAARTIKHYASSELGAWAAANTLAVEETAAHLREAWERFARGEGRRAP